MSYNYDDILSEHLTSFKSSSRSRSRSRSRSHSRSTHKRRHTKNRKRDRSRDRTREHRDRSRDRSHHKRHEREHRDRRDRRPRPKPSRYRNHHRHPHPDHKRKPSESEPSSHSHHPLLSVIGNEAEEDEAQFAQKVEEELRAKEEHLVASQLAAKSKTSKRKERLKRLQKLRLQKQAEISRKTTSDTPQETANGYRHNNNSPQNHINNNTENIQSVACEEEEEDEEVYDIFAQNDNILSIKKKKTTAKAQGNTAHHNTMVENPHLSHNWDDSEGYYVVVVGDIIDAKYEVMGTSGKGVYSSVLRVRDIRSEEKGNEYVIKVIRNNEHMKKQGLREIEFLREMRLRDTLSKHHCIVLYDSFWFRNHLCLLFEGMKCDLRRLLRSINISHSGLSIKAVYEYTKQLFRALQLLNDLSIIHADIKPDNILVSADYRTVKLCDFGSSFKMDEVELTPTVGSRYYRAPEIMIGINWATPCDVWSLACTLFEIYSTNFLFKGANNNEMLLNILKLCGLPPLNTKNSATNYKTGMFYAQHFNENGDFLESKYDAVAQFDILIPHKLVNKSHFCANNMSHILLNKLSNIRNPNVNVHLNYHERCKLNQFADLLAKMLNLNVNKRITPKQALKHPFCANPMK